MTRRKRDAGRRTFLDVYKRIRKPMPPPDRVIPDRRRQQQDEEARREIEEGDRTRGGSPDA